MADYGDFIVELYRNGSELMITRMLNLSYVSTSDNRIAGIFQPDPDQILENLARIRIILTSLDISNKTVIQLLIGEVISSSNFILSKGRRHAFQHKIMLELCKIDPMFIEEYIPSKMQKYSLRDRSTEGTIEKSLFCIVSFITKILPIISGLLAYWYGISPNIDAVARDFILGSNNGAGGTGHVVSRYVEIIEYVISHTQPQNFEETITIKIIQTQIKYISTIRDIIAADTRNRKSPQYSEEEYESINIVYLASGSRPNNLVLTPRKKYRKCSIDFEKTYCHRILRTSFHLIEIIISSKPIEYYTHVWWLYKEVTVIALNNILIYTTQPLFRSICDELLNIAISMLYTDPGIRDKAELSSRAIEKFLLFTNFMRQEIDYKFVYQEELLIELSCIESSGAMPNSMKYTLHSSFAEFASSGALGELFNNLSPFRSLEWPKELVLEYFDHGAKRWLKLESIPPPHLIPKSSG